MFQASGYLIDVYNGKCKPERNFFKFLLFVSFFPQLIQGPINKFEQLSPELYAPHSFDWEKTKKALFSILFGLMKKYTVANLLAGDVGKIFDVPKADTPGSVIVFGILLYSIQEYADFSGGIDILTGVGELFGIKMMQNFRQPYFAVSLSDFWRRWHISLGAWMRDYIFYPLALTKPMQSLGKNCGKKFGKHLGWSMPAGIANIVVFCVVGLWHGAELHFIMWGLYNGIVIALSDILSPVFARISSVLKIHTESKFFYVFRIIRTFILVNIGRYFDRVEHMKDCFLYLKNTIFNFNGSMLFAFDIEFLHSKIAVLLIPFSLLILFINSLLAEQGNAIYDILQSKHTALRWSIYYIMMFLILFSFVLAFTSKEGFLYANF